jgi:hypothetical protein
MPAVAVYKRVSDLVFMHSAAGVVIYIYKHGGNPCALFEGNPPGTMR